jgi:tRNA1(Val) A37 N6-methylase TrmN6
MMLMEAKRGGKSGMQLTMPLIIYKDSAHREYTEDMEYIMENGYFPKKFKR